MTKRTLNQNGKYVQELINIIEPDFIFDNKPVNRLKSVRNIYSNDGKSKIELISNLKKQIFSIENCKLKN